MEAWHAGHPTPVAIDAAYDLGVHNNHPVLTGRETRDVKRHIQGGCMACRDSLATIFAESSADYETIDKLVDAKRVA